MEFNQSDCHVQAMTLVSNGAAIIAELLRLSNHIPDVFLFQKTTAKEQKKGKVIGTEQFMAANGKTVSTEEARLRYAEQRKYLQILFDLEYVQDPDRFDNAINDSIELSELDDSFKESYYDIIKRFYDMFEQIYLFYGSVTSYLQDIRDGKYIEFTIDALIQMKEGKRLIAEIMHSYAAMLLLLDRLIPSVARERIVTCYVRYMGSSASHHHAKVCKLIKSTGYFNNKFTQVETIPDKYPAKYFSRFKLDQPLVEQFINAMKDDDIYDMTGVYGNDPMHRSHALATQASIIFCLLPFVPLILDDQQAKMREICDKHFPDNWVIPIYGGQLADLLAYWESWPAAKKALENNIVPTRVEQLALMTLDGLKTNNKKLGKYIIEGQLQEKETLANMKELLGVLRDANTCIKWVMLHEHSTNKVMKELVSSIVKEGPLVRLLLRLSKFEHLLKELVTQIVKKKNKMWTKDKEQIVHDMNEVSEFFAGNRDWGGEYEDQYLSEWCQQISTAVEDFEYKNTTKVGRKIQKMVEALEDLQLQHNIVEENALIQDKIQRTINNLMHMIRIMGIKKEFLEHMRIISDFSFAWIAMERYLPILREVITSDADNVMMLRTVFLKMSSIMDTPLLHISNAGSSDFDSVANYYSTQLLDYVQRVLQVIPVKIFEELDYISTLMSTQIREFEVKVSKEFLKENALRDVRFELAKKTHEITLLTEGMLKLDKTLMGVIELDPKNVLVVGLRNELCRKLAEILHNEFIFTNLGSGSAVNLKAQNAAQIEMNSKGVKVQGGKAAFGEFGEKFEKLKSNFVGLKRSIEFIQDFLNIQGEKIWREEFQRVIELAVEREATKLVNKKYTANIDSNETQYIPTFEPVDEHDITFMGRLLTAVLKSMGKGVYLDQMSHWYTRDGEQTFGLRFINFLHENLGTQFLQAFDKLIEYKLVSELRTFYRDYSINIGGGSCSSEIQKRMIPEENVNLVRKIRAFDKLINGNFESLSMETLTHYYALMQLIKPRLIAPLLPRIQTIGKLQLLRKLICKQIHYSAKVESSQFTNVLVTLNNSILENLPEIKENATAAYADDDGIDMLDETGNLNQSSMPNQMFGNTVPLSRAEREGMASKQLNSMLQHLTVCSEAVGFLNPMNKVYAVTLKLESMSSFFTIFTLAMFQYLRYDTGLCSIMRKNQNSEFEIDGPHLICGMLTIFKQFHNSNYRAYLLKLIHFFKNVVFGTTDSRPAATQLPPDGFLTLTFLEELIKFEGASREVISQNIGTFIFDAYRKEQQPTR